MRPVRFPNLTSACAFNNGWARGRRDRDHVTIGRARSVLASRSQCYAANREQPQIENSNEMHDIHCAISVFMAEVQTTLAGTMNTCKALARAMNNTVYTCGAADDSHALHNKCTQEFCDISVQYLDPHTTKDHL